MAHATRAAANRVNDYIPTTANWVAGHADIHLNEHADWLAKQAAARSKRGRGLQDIERRIAVGDFIPPQCSRTRHIQNYFAGD